MEKLENDEATKVLTHTHTHTKQFMLFWNEKILTKRGKWLNLTAGVFIESKMYETIIRKHSKINWKIL